MQRSFEVLDSEDSGNLPGVPSLLEIVCRVLCCLYSIILRVTSTH